MKTLIARDVSFQSECPQNPLLNHFEEFDHENKDEHDNSDGKMNRLSHCPRAKFRHVSDQSHNVFRSVYGT